MNEIQHNIIKRLIEIEQNEMVKIPLAIESGSRGWGFESPDSDYDCRFIYVRKKESYLSVFEQKDVLEDPVDEIYDVSGWDLKKVIRHLVKSNAVMYEWLSSDLIYQINPPVRELLWQTGEYYFNPIAVSWQYLSLAKNKLHQIEKPNGNKIKTYFYILRPLAALAYIRLHGKIPHMKFQENLIEIDLPVEIRTIVRELLELKKTVGEKHQVTLDDRLLDYFRQQVMQGEEYIKNIRYEKKNNYSQADEAFRTIIAMVWDNE